MPPVDAHSDVPPHAGAPAGGADAVDVLVVGAGAAGMMAALAARGALTRDGTPAIPPADSPRVVVLDGSPRVGLKILVSGGGRCNVTNERVTDADFDTDVPHMVRGFLAAFPPASMQTFLTAHGCPLYAEPLGKLFPRTDRASDVLDTMLRALAAVDVPVVAGSLVTGVNRGADGLWEARVADGHVHRARRIIIATGGRSLPKTGSTGFGYDLARKLGHTVDALLPALTPIRLTAHGPLDGLSGITVPAILSLVPRGTTSDQLAGARFRPVARAAGSVLVTHHGISGPAALDISGACGLALARKEDLVLQADFWTLIRDDSPWLPWRDAAKLPGACLPPDETPRPISFDGFMPDALATFSDGKRSLLVALAKHLPRALVEALLRPTWIAHSREARNMTEKEWRKIHAAFTQCDLGLSTTEGYEKAEVTRGGVPLAELHRTTLESRKHADLYFCGEVAHATGRLGGFNFQWAWSSGFAAGQASVR